MESIIFRYITKGGEPMLSIGSKTFFHQKIKTCRQLLEMVMLVHSEEQWEELVEKTQDELYETLEAMLWNNPLMVERPC